MGRVCWCMQVSHSICLAWGPQTSPLTPPTTVERRENEIRRSRALAPVALARLTNRFSPALSVFGNDAQFFLAIRVNRLQCDVFHSMFVASFF